jgi:hypothetical protein
MRTPYPRFLNCLACFWVQAYAASQHLGSRPSSAVSTPGAKKGTFMEAFLVLAIVIIVGFGLYRFMRARAAH